MVIYDSNINFGGLILEITRMVPRKRQKTVKQKIGRSVAQLNILGLDGQQWELDIEGVITGTSPANLESKRDSLQALDNARGHALVDGKHNGTFYIEPGSLEFNDVGGDIENSFSYSMRLIEV
jgi:hypothetical protein